MVNIDRSVPPAALQLEHPTLCVTDFKTISRARITHSYGRPQLETLLPTATYARTRGPQIRPGEISEIRIWRFRRRGQNEQDATLGIYSTKRHAREHRLKRGVLLCVETNISSQAGRRKQIISIRPINDTTTTIGACKPPRLIRL